MDCQNLTAILNEIKEKFDKSYKCLSQNRTIQKQTANKHIIILVESFNQARSRIHDPRGKLDKNQ